MWNKLQQTFSHYTFFWKNMNPFAICRSLGVQTFLWKHKSSSLFCWGKKNKIKIQQTKNRSSLQNNLFPKPLVVVFKQFASKQTSQSVFWYYHSYQALQRRTWATSLGSKRWGGHFYVYFLMFLILHDNFKCGKWVSCLNWTQTKHIYA